MKMWTEEDDRRLKKLILEEASYQEIGDELGRSSESVRKRWGRIRDQEKVVTVREKHYPRVTLKACVFDIETMNFTTDGYGDHLVSCSVLGLEDPEPVSYVIEFEEQRNDRELLGRVLDAMKEYDILIGHNIAAYDLNWLQSRAMYHGLLMPRSWVYYDTYQVAKTMAIKAASKSLGALGAYFNLDGVKTRIFKTDWSMMDSPIKAEYLEAREMIEYHCNQDVLLNRNLFDVLWAYDPRKSFKKTKW